ncbi:phosphoenolpyruvate carboxylase [Pseudorhodoferax aquiterrae]|uniref:Phosphoenolpyruvate carboxylase n=1 Tax=Pseudorhodoferax aquiterrae TaxID=747304 RepID=A0ABQ3GDX9_9BURK|nr:putative sulfate exporter family transporter [Pseudorhodoferax aquiterrae]GHD02994.1 phosphoenolpyruvate carboxylase [Pseudorhodoferax aquiterrae]
MAVLTVTAWEAHARALFPGVLACAVVAAAATFLSQHYGAPVMLFALMLGMAMNFLSGEGPCRPGIEFTARQLLRWGVALLGLRITADQVAGLGWHPVLVVAVSLVLTIGVSMLVARLMGFNILFGLLSGGATAICGASAALALSAALPPHPLKERATLFTVVGVSALSTLTMVLYPMLARALGLDAPNTGAFLGATIHDVAQVVGAGYGVSQEVGDTATLVKLLRVATLLPVILFAVAFTRATGRAGDGPRPPLLPWFAVGFAALVALNSTGWLPRALTQAGTSLSGWLLLAAMAAIGMKTQLRELATVGLKPVVLMVGETVFLAALALALLRWS